MSYQIKRECWNEKTYNGYGDNPYWNIKVNGLDFGLNDDGFLWGINNSIINDENIDIIKEIINECNLKIKIKQNENFSRV